MISPAFRIIEAAQHRPGTQGCVDGMMDDEYRSAPGLSQSALSVFHDSPRNYINGVQKTVTEAMRSGSISHSAVLENRLDVHIRPETYMKAGKKAGDPMTVAPWSGNSKTCQAWLEEHRDKPVMTQERYDGIKAVVEYTHRHPWASGLLSGGFAELSCFADCPKTGVRLKGRMDYVKQEDQWTTIVDLKRTRDGDTHEFSKTIFYMRYHVQAAMYRRILQALGATFVRYYLIALEEGDAPRLNVRELNPRAIDEGERQLNSDLQRLDECKKSGVWPEWGDDNGTGSIPLIDLPEFAYSDEIEISE